MSEDSVVVSVVDDELLSSVLVAPPQPASIVTVMVTPSNKAVNFFSFIFASLLFVLETFDDFIIPFHHV